MHFTMKHLLPIIALILGFFAIIAPRHLNYIVGAFLILFGVFGMGFIR